MSYIIRYPLGWKGVMIYGYVTHDGFHRWNSGLVLGKSLNHYAHREELFDPRKAKRFWTRQYAWSHAPEGHMRQYLQLVEYEKEVERYEMRRILQEIL